MEAVPIDCPDDVNLVAENEVRELRRAARRTDAFLRHLAAGLPPDGSLWPEGSVDPLLFFGSIEGEEWP